MRNLTLLILIGLISISFFYLYPGSAEGLVKPDSFEIIAQRGVHHAYPRHSLGPDVCAAEHILKPTHGFIENTIASIQAAFDYGATVVEFDVRPTKDHQLVVFHDDDLACRTDAEGYVWDLSLDELKQLDLGYGYTFDAGKTYPFRGKAVGEISTLTEVLQRFPDKKFLIDHKNRNDFSSSDLLIDLLLSMSVVERERIYLRAEDKDFAYIKEKVPTVSRLIEPRKNQGKFFKNYIYSFGLKDFNLVYANKGFAMPKFMKKYVWGWPYRFLQKVSAVKARIYIFVDSKEEFEQVSDLPIDGIVTYHIEQLELSAP